MLSAEATLERQEALKQSINSIVIKQKNFLGNLDYGHDFTRFIRPNQLNWDFCKPPSKSPLKVVLFGQVAAPYNGTKLGAVRNYKPLEGRPIKALEDGTNVHNVLGLEMPTDLSPRASIAFNNQFAPLNRIEDDVLKYDEETKTEPKNKAKSRWVDSSAEINELRRPIDIILVSLPRKYKAAPADFVPTDESIRLTQRVRLTADDDDEPTIESHGQSSSFSSDKISQKSSSSKPQAPASVKIGDYVEPCLLPDYSPDKLSFVTNKLIQYDITDIEGNLIPAYDIAKGLRPGTIVVVEAELHVYNIYIKKKEPQSGFNRFFSITAKRIRVLAESLHHPSHTPEISPTPTETTSGEPDIFTLLPTKRKKMPTDENDQKSKRLKKENQITDQEMSD